MAGEFKQWIEEDRKYFENLAAVRRAAELTQQCVAEKLGMAEAGVSRLESQGDMLLSTLAGYLQALGERPRVTVTIDGQDFEIELSKLVG